MYKKTVFLMVALTFCSAMAFAQESTTVEKDKYTVNNYMITKVYQCTEGLIVNYIDRDGMKKVMYVPNKFFREKKAFRFLENNDTLAPQMNIVLKNKKAEKIKLYLADKQSNTIYRYVELVSKDVYDKFQIDEIQIDL